MVPMMNEKMTFGDPKKGDISTETMGRPIGAKETFSHTLGDPGSAG